MLPMHWQGTPVSLWCNKPAEPATTSAQPQDPVSHTLKSPPSDINAGVQQSNFFPRPWGYPFYHLAPTTTTAKPAAKDPEPMVHFPGYPGFYPPYPWPYPGPLPTPAETTTTKPTTTQSQFPQDSKFPPYGQQMMQFPLYKPFQPYPPYPWPYPGPLPTPAETTTTKPTTTQSQFPQEPKFPPYGQQMMQFPLIKPFQPYPP